MPACVKVEAGLREPVGGSLQARAMAGGYHTRRQHQRDRALRDRVTSDEPGSDPHERDLAVPDSPKPAQPGPELPVAPTPNPGPLGSERLPQDGSTGPLRPEARPRACWIRWPGEPTPGHVLHWHRAGNTWWALVLATVPGALVTPRAETERETPHHQREAGSSYDP